MTDLRDDFDRCWPWLKAGLEYNAFTYNGKLWVTHTKEDVWLRIVNGKAFLWPGEVSAFMTEFYDSPTRLKTHHNWLAGGNKDEIKWMMPTIEEWGRSHGCHRQTGSGRAGWLRIFEGYEEVGRRKQKSLIE